MYSNTKIKQLTCRHDENKDVTEPPLKLSNAVTINFVYNFVSGL